MAEWLELPTSDHKVPGLNPAGGVIQFMTLWCFISQPFIITFLLSWYHLNVEKDVKHQGPVFKASLA